MNILCIFISSILFISSVLIQTVKPFNKVCGYSGEMWPTPDFQFSASDVPARCDGISYGFYYFDRDPHMKDKDISAISTLISGNKIVFIDVGFMEMAAWENIVDSNETFECNKNITSLMEHINKTKINGIIIEIFDLFGGTIVNFSDKIVTFINKMKENISTLQIGLSVNGYTYKSFSNKTAFDFSVTNSAVDFYIIDLTGGLNSCSENSTTSGFNPPSTIEAINDAISGSGMEKTKLQVCVPIQVQNQERETKINDAVSYAAFCSGKESPSKDECPIYCRDTISIAYNLGKLLKQTYQAIWFADVSGDDFQAACGCDKFPMINTYLDGWDSVPMKDCPKLD